MKKLTKVILGFIAFAIVIGIIGNKIDQDKAAAYDDDNDDRPYSETVPAFDYEGMNTVLSEVIAEYPLQGEGEYATCRVIYQSTDESLVFTMEADRYIEGPDNTYILQYTSPEKAAEAQAKLQANESVAYAEPDALAVEEGLYSWGTTDMGTDTFSTQMALHQVYTPTIAVVDSGVNYHDMVGSMLPGWDFVGNDSEPRDERGHGTAVAGVVSDVMGDMTHTILPVRVLGADGRGYTSQIALGVRYAADNGAEIINMSLSCDHSATLETAVEYAINKGCSVVAAAGNQRSDVHFRCPQHMAGPIVVSAVDSNYTFCSFSNFGTGVDICAPGMDVIVANMGGGTKISQGTSIAAPHISGILGLILGSGTAETTYEAELLLFNSCIDLGEAGKDFQYGYGYPDMTGILNAYNEKQKQKDYWILYENKNDPAAVANIWFNEDGTYEAVDVATGATSTGTYFGLGDYQLTFWEDAPTYFMGKDFFDNTGINYETSSTYQSSGEYDHMAQLLVHCSGVHPYTDKIAEKWYQEEPTSSAPAASSSAPSSGSSLGNTILLGDGTYYVDFYLSSIRTDGYNCALTADFLGIIELSDSEVRSLSAGTYYGGNFNLNVEYVRFSTIDGVQYVDINDWEYGRYIPDRGVWRFYTVNDQPLTYYSTTADIPIAGDAVLWDYLTPFIFGQNAIGMQEGDFMDRSDPFYCTASIADFCDWHLTMSPYMVNEKAYMTVSGGMVTSITINAHP